MRSERSTIIRITASFGVVVVAIAAAVETGNRETVAEVAHVISSPVAAGARADEPAVVAARLDNALRDCLSPLPANVEIHEWIIGEDGATAGTTAGTSRLVYSNTLGKHVFGPSDSLYNARFADDITTTAIAGCHLDRYVILVTGDKYGDGSGVGPFGVDFALYETCPGADEGATLIEGTAVHVYLPDNGTYTVMIVIPPGVDVPIPSSLYLGVSFDRVKAGVVVGAPADVGFSADRFDFPGFPCAAGLGGFPDGPHASFYAQIYVRDDCQASFVGYKNSNHAGVPFSAGMGNHFADDISLATDECNLVALEFAHRGNGVVGLDLRTHLDNSDPVNGGLIPGTRWACFSSGDDAQICRFDFEEPIPLSQSNIFAVYRASNPTVGPLLTCKQASPGYTTNLFQVYMEGRWKPQESAGSCYGGFDLTIYCDGLPPVGACCDMNLADDENEAVCRDSVAEMNCATPELWLEGASCESECDGGDYDGQPCTRQADCPGGDCDGPFPHPCGVSACCTPTDRCENLTENQCNALPPLDWARLWLPGQFCNEMGQRCPIMACLNGEGNCCEARAREACCVGGPFDGVDCNPSAWPDQCDGYGCIGGPNDGRPCTFAGDDCLPDGTCEWITEGVCIGDRQRGCSDRTCCEDVCSSQGWGWPWEPSYLYCCTEYWDESCAALAQLICDCSPPSSDECWDPEHGVGARLIEIPGVMESDGIHATTSDTEPGFCCHEEDPGAQGVGTVWYKFVAADTSARLDTCCSAPRPDAPADDSLIQVFAVADPDRGLCEDGLTICSVSAQDCADGSICVLDEEYACSNLMPIACSDDDEECSCHGYVNPELSKLCVTGLVPGDMYYVMVGGKTEDNRGVYQLRIASPCTPDLPPLHNDLCMNAEQLTGEHVEVQFDLSGELFGEAPATFDCPGPPPYMVYMQNDVWYDWVAPCNGTVVVHTCDGWYTWGTKLCLYEGCDCPVAFGSEVQCDWFLNEVCFLGSIIGITPYPLINVVEGECYKIRLGGNHGTTPAGPLKIDVECAPKCPIGPVTFADPPNGVVDARRPHPPSDPATRQGIETLRIEAPDGADHLECWSLCETAEDGSVSTITNVVDNGNGTFTVTLARPISTGAVTTITYTDDDATGQCGVFTSHPGNVNGDNAASPADILFLIDVLNGVRTSPWGIYSTDCDHSGVIGPQDILCIIDLLNGAGTFDVWLNMPRPTPDACLP